MIMNQRDLRIGSRIIHNGNEVVVIGIRPNGDINYVRKGLSYGGFNVKYFQPITLFGDRLKQLGFEHTPNENNGGKYSMLITYLDLRWSLDIWNYSSENNVNFTVVLTDLDVGNEVVLPIELRFVHQLQNLAHALSGKELSFTSIQD